MSRTAPLNVVADDALEQLLESLGLLGKFNRGDLRCAFSGDIITWQNLEAIFPDSGSVKVICSRPRCVHSLSERLHDLGEQRKR